MKKKKFTLKTQTDIKVFILFLLEYIRYPIDRTTLIEIISENTEEIIIDYEDSLTELSESGHILLEELDGEKYCMITPSGRQVAHELVDTLDEGFRNKSIKSAMKFMSLSERGARHSADIIKMEDGTYTVHLRLADPTCELFNVKMNVSSLAEATGIRDNFRSRPEVVYKGFIVAANGKFDLFE